MKDYSELTGGNCKCCKKGCRYTYSMYVSEGYKLSLNNFKSLCYVCYENFIMEYKIGVEFNKSEIGFNNFVIQKFRNDIINSILK